MEIGPSTMFTPVLFLVIISHVGERAVLFVSREGSLNIWVLDLKISTPHLGQVLLLKVLINYPQKTVVSFMLDKGLEGVHYLNNRLRFVSSNNGHFLGLYLNLNDILFWKGERQKHIQ